MIKFLANSFRGLPNIYSNHKAKFIIVVCIFFLVSFFSSFPGNVSAIRNGGFRGETLLTEYQEQLPSWFPNELPTNIVSVGPRGLDVLNDDIATFKDERYTFVLNFPDKEDFKKSSYYNDKETIYVLTPSHIIIYDHGTQMTASYSGFSSKIVWANIKYDASGEQLMKFFSGIHESFKGLRIMFAVIWTTLINIIMNLALILILALMCQLFKFGCQDFLKFKDLIKVVVSCMLWPTTVSCLISFFLIIWVPDVGAISQVINMWGIGILVVLVMMKVARKQHTSATYGKEIR